MVMTTVNIVSPEAPPPWIPGVLGAPGPPGALGMTGTMFGARGGMAPFVGRIGTGRPGRMGRGFDFRGGRGAKLDGPATARLPLLTVCPRVDIGDTAYRYG